MPMTFFWLAALVLFGVAEAATVGLVSIWFALGALGALIVAWVGLGLWVQVGVFLVVSLVALLLVRPLSQKYLLADRHATNADRAVGQQGVVTQQIDNLSGQGQVTVRGVPWTARTEDQELIPQGETVTVLRIEGVKLIVRRATMPGDTGEH